MPPRPKALPPAPPPNVARMSVEEQIGSLFHWYEGFADWRLQVDERLDRSEENSERLTIKVDQVDTKIDGLSAKMDTRHNESILIQQQVLLVVQGQRIPGMERPGLSDDLKAMSTELVSIKALYAELKSADTSRKGWVAGVVTVVSVVGTALAAYFYQTFHSLFILLNHLPPSK